MYLLISLVYICIFINFIGIVVANKIDLDSTVTTKVFKFASERDIPFYFVSAADGTNVVKVRI